MRAGKSQGDLETEFGNSADHWAVEVNTAVRVQSMLPPNVAPWHTEYFNLKESEKTAEARRLP